MWTAWYHAQTPRTTRRKRKHYRPRLRKGKPPAIPPRWKRLLTLFIRRMIRPHFDVEGIALRMGRSCIRLAALALAIIGCAKPPLEPRAAADANDVGGTFEPKTELERAVLQALPGLPDNAPKKIAGATVVAEAAYAAASDRTCRALTFSDKADGQATRRLACLSGGHWVFVPDVFGSSAPEP